MTLAPLTSLYLYPVLTTGLTPYDPSQPQKTWARPLEPGEAAADDYIYTYAALDASLHTFVMSKGAAAAMNVPGPTEPNVFVNGTVIPFPLKPLAAGQHLTPNPLEAFGGMPLVATDDQAAAPTDPVAEILAIVQAIKAKLGA